MKSSLIAMRKAFLPQTNLMSELIIMRHSLSLDVAGGFLGFYRLRSIDWRINQI